MVVLRYSTLQLVWENVNFELEGHWIPPYSVTKLVITVCDQGKYQGMSQVKSFVMFYFYSIPQQDLQHV